jgi:GNAT superfamily N-acetyltransferase
MPVEIRFATPEDAPAIHRFVRELAEYEKEPHAVEATVESLRRELERTPPPFECLIAELDGEAAGFALFFHNYSTWKGRRGLYIEDLYVPARLRRRGIGRALVLAVGELARERDCGRLEWAVLDWNEPAIAFYRSLGAAPLTEWSIWRLSGRALDEFGRLKC